MYHANNLDKFIFFLPPDESHLWITKFGIRFWTLHTHQKSAKTSKFLFPTFLFFCKSWSFEGLLLLLFFFCRTIFNMNPTLTSYQYVLYHIKYSINPYPISIQTENYIILCCFRKFHHHHLRYLTNHDSFSMIPIDFNVLSPFISTVFKFQTLQQHKNSDNNKPKKKHLDIVATTSTPTKPLQQVSLQSWIFFFSMVPIDFHG